MPNATKAKREKTVAEKYAGAYSGASATLDLVAREMKRHEENAANDPNNSQHVKEMLWVTGRLSEILMTLIGGEKEIEVAAMIHEHMDVILPSKTSR